MSIFSVSKDSPAQQVWQSAWGPGLLVNLDFQNPAYVGIGTPNVTTSSDTLPAGATMAVTGDQDVYASTLNSAITVQVQSMPGVTSWTPPPPVVLTKAASTAGALPAQIFVFPAAGRIWAAQLSAAVATDGSYSGGLASFPAFMQDGLGNTLLETSVLISAASQALVSNVALPLNGLLVDEGTQILVLTQSSSPSHVEQSAAAVLYYSIP